MAEFTNAQLSEIHHAIMQHLSNLEIKVTDEEPVAMHYPDDCVFYEGHCFKVFPEAKTWWEAKAACEEIGGHLATSTGPEKNAFLTILSEGKSLWLGGTDNAGEGNWQWITGEEWSYTNWNPGEPNNVGDREHYLELNYGTVGNWNDLSAALELGYICEWDGKFYLHLNPEDIPHEELDENTNKQLTELQNTIMQNFANLEIKVTDKERNCPKDCKFCDGHLFKLFAETKTWAEARKACEARSGHLATSTSAEKNKFLTSLANGNRVWLGGTDEGTEGTWKWITGEEWNYTNWNTGQPDNSGGLENYLELNYGTIGRWNDLSATYKLDYYICECDYEPCLVLDPKDISHEKLDELLGGNEDGHYHITADEHGRLGQIITALFPDGAEEPVIPDVWPDPEPQPVDDGEAGDVYAIGKDAEAWSNNAEVDDYGFRKLPMPKAKRLVSLDNMICAMQLENGKWYGCQYGGNINFGIKDFKPTVPTEIPLDDISEMAKGSIRNVGNYTYYLDSNGNCRVFNTASPSSAPTNLSNIRKISSAGYNHCLAMIDDDGCIVSINASGVISKQSTGLSASSIKTVSYFGLSFWILTTDGELYETSYGSKNPATKIEFPYGKIKEIYSVQSISLSSRIESAVFVLTEDNDLYAKGANYFSNSSNHRLGLPGTGYGAFTKVGNYNVKRICSDGFDTFMLLEDGTLWHTGSFRNLSQYRIADKHKEFTQIFPEVKFKDVAYIYVNLVVIKDAQQTTDWGRTELPKNLYRYSCSPNIERMYYGLIAYQTNPYIQTGLVIPVVYKNLNTQSELTSFSAMSLYTDNLVQWSNYSAYTYNLVNPDAISTIPTRTDYLYADWNKTTTNTNSARLFYFMVSPEPKKKIYYKVSAATGAKNIPLNTTGTVAGCYSPELRRALFVSAEGIITRFEDTSTKANTVTPTKVAELAYCGIKPNVGCLKWSPAVGVFCVTGSDGIATSTTGEEGSWIKCLVAPENLNGLEYRADINGGSFIAWSAADKHIYTSTQGTFWTKYSTNPIPLDDVAAVAYSPETGYYCAVPKKGNTAYLSKDLATWRSTKISNREDLGVNDVVWMANIKKFVLLPTEGYILYTYKPE